jgi:hypothetical protein
MGLTKEQTDQQDFVDNAIWEMICTVLPDVKDDESLTLKERKEYEWDSSIIAKIRNIIIDHFTLDENDDEDGLLMRFYPYLKDGEDE